MDLGVFRPDAFTLALAVALDFAIGDPVYRLHPVRLMGRTLASFEAVLFRLGAGGYGGGIALFLLLVICWVVAPAALRAWLAHFSPTAAFVFDVFLVYSLLALHDLLRHAWQVERAAAREDTLGAREAISRLVGRDTSQMDIAACRRAAIESISENLTDGWVSALFWYALAGLPGLLSFKVVSTMDSMVGYKSERYLRFGWCGARLDDWMNWLPARFTWLLLAFVALLIPGCSARATLRIGWQQHAVLPGPNSGWSEAAMAGALQRRLIGPIWAHGALVTSVWLGDPASPPAAEHADVIRAAVLVAVAGVLAAVLAITLIALRH